MSCGLNNPQAVCLSPWRVRLDRWIRPLRWNSERIFRSFIKVSNLLSNKLQKWSRCHQLIQTISVVMLNFFVNRYFCGGTLQSVKTKNIINPSIKVIVLVPKFSS